MKPHTIAALLVLLLAGGFAISVDGSGNNSRDATTLPTEATTTRPSVCLEKLLVPPIEINDKPLHHVVALLCERIGTGVVFVDMKSERKLAQTERRIRQLSIKKATPFGDVLQEVSNACGGLDWQYVGGAPIISVRGVKALTDNPLEKPLKPQVFKGPLKEFWAKVVNEVPELHPCTTWSPKVGSTQVRFETKTPVTVKAAMAMLAGKHGVQWNVTVQEKLREIPWVIEIVGKPGSKQTITIWVRTYVTCSIRTSARKTDQIGPSNDAMKTPESSPSAGRVEGPGNASSRSRE